MSFSGGFQFSCSSIKSWSIYQQAALFFSWTFLSRWAPRSSAFTITSSTWWRSCWVELSAESLTAWPVLQLSSTSSGKTTHYETIRFHLVWLNSHDKLQVHSTWIFMLSHWVHEDELLVEANDWMSMLSDQVRQEKLLVQAVTPEYSLSHWVH